MCIPVCGLKEEEEDCGAPEDGMKRKALNEPVERPGPALREFGTESVAPDVRHVIFFRQRRNSAGWILAVEGLAEKDKICKSSPN